jgi:spermidine/putrescine transport system substrate-binding protein
LGKTLPADIFPRKALLKLRLVVAVLGMALILLAGCGKKERLYIYNWTYYTPDTIIKKFEKEFGVKVIYDEFASNEDMHAKIKVGGGAYDVVFPSGDYVSIMMHQNMLEEIDHSKIPNLKNIDPAVLEKATHDPHMKYSVPYFFGTAGIIVNTARVPDFEHSWSIFARQDLRNRMTMLDDMREVLGAALVVLGYSVNSKNLLEIAEARDYINANWKPNLVKFDSESFGKGYSNGDFWVVHGFPEAVFEEIAHNPQLLKNTFFFIPKEGGPAYIDCMCILKGAKNIELAHKFINFIHRPDIYAEFVDAFKFPATANIPARRYKTGASLYTVEELANSEVLDDPGPALEFFNEVWFNSVRVE